MINLKNKFQSMRAKEVETPSKKIILLSISPIDQLLIKTLKGFKVFSTKFLILPYSQVYNQQPGQIRKGYVRLCQFWHGRDILGQVRQVGSDYVKLCQAVSLIFVVYILKITNLESFGFRFSLLNAALVQMLVTPQNARLCWARLCQDKLCYARTVVSIKFCKF